MPVSMRRTGVCGVVCRQVLHQSMYNFVFSRRQRGSYDAVYASQHTNKLYREIYLADKLRPEANNLFFDICRMRVSPFKNLCQWLRESSSPSMRLQLGWSKSEALPHLEAACLLAGRDICMQYKENLWSGSDRHCSVSNPPSLMNGNQVAR